MFFLEAKLKRTRGAGSKEPQAKDIISGLHKIRESQMLTQLNDTDNLPYIRNSEYIEDFHPSAVGLLQRKIAPDKQALNAEELKVLVENDELEKMTSTSSCTDNETKVSRSEIDLQR